MVEVGGTGASARHGVPAKTAHQCRFHASTLLRDGSRGLPPLPPSVYDGGSSPSLLHLAVFSAQARLEVLRRRRQIIAFA